AFFKPTKEMNFDIEALKAKHGKGLSLVTIEMDKDEKYEFVIKRPSKNLIDAVADLNDQKSKEGTSRKVLEMMEKNCVIAGDMEALQDGVVWSRLMDRVKEVFKQGKSA